MGTRLIFLDQEVVTDFESRTGLLDCLCGLEVPGNSPSIRPYPKPTQVVR
jgi:hypothetical protein